MNIVQTIEEKNRIKRAVEKYKARRANDSSPLFNICGCLGPQNGEPKCPCAMRSIVQVDNIYYQITNLLDGPLSAHRLDDNNNKASLPSL